MSRFSIFILSMIFIISVFASIYADNGGGGGIYLNSGVITDSGMAGRVGKAAGQGRDSKVGELCSAGYDHDRQLLKETEDAREELKKKRFEYFDARRDPETMAESVVKLKDEMRELKYKLYEKTTRASDKGFSAYGC
jgi:hypothetical protein